MFPLSCRPVSCGFSRLFAPTGSKVVLAWRKLYQHPALFHLKQVGTGYMAVSRLQVHFLFGGCLLRVLLIGFGLNFIVPGFLAGSVQRFGVDSCLVRITSLSNSFASLTGRTAMPCAVYKGVK